MVATESLNWQWKINSIGEIAELPYARSVNSSLVDYLFEGK